VQSVHHDREQYTCPTKLLSILLSATRAGNTSHHRFTPPIGAGWERFLGPISDLVGRLPGGCGDPSGTAGPLASGGRPLPTGVVTPGLPTARETLVSPQRLADDHRRGLGDGGATGAGRGAAPDVSRSSARSLGLRCRPIERC